MERTIPKDTDKNIERPAAYLDPATDAEDLRHNPLPASLPRLPGVFLLVVLGLGFGAALVTPETFRWPREGSFLRGEQAARYEKAFNEALPFRDAAIATWGVLEYTLFHEGREGVVVGQQGWLFTGEEVAFYEDAAAETARKLAYVKKVQAELAAKGVTLIVGLVPDKSRVYPEFVGRTLPSYTKNRYESFRRSLTQAGITAPDLLTPLISAKEKTQVYLRTDTHWTPAGAEVAADALAEAARRADVGGLFESKYETTVNGRTQHKGDLLNFLPLGVLQGRLGPAPDTLETRQTRALNSSAGGLFGVQTVPVTLVGTSYSADERWNFAGALQQALSADVLDVATEGQGPLPPMRDYLQSSELRDAPPQLVVWEIPERYLPMPEAP